MDALLSDPIPTAIECSVLVLWCLFLRSFPRVAGGYTVLIAAALSTLQPEHRGPAVTGQETMFAAVFASGFTHGVRIARVPVPSHTSGEVLVRVQAAGLNPSNFKIDMSKIPFMRLLRTPIVGHDCAGVAVSVGSGTEYKGFSTGDALYGFAAGSIAEFAVLSCGKAAQKSHVFSAAEAAGRDGNAGSPAGSRIDRIAAITGRGGKAGEGACAPVLIVSSQREWELSVCMCDLRL